MDTAVFEPDTFEESITTFESNHLAVRMKNVLMDGMIILRDGRGTGHRGGEALRARLIFGSTEQSLSVGDAFGAK